MLELETLAENNCHHAAKRVKKSKNEDLNEKVWEWFVAARSKNIPVSGPGVYLGTRSALIGASLESSEEQRCLQCDSILVPGCYHPWNYKIDHCLGAI